MPLLGIVILIARYFLDYSSKKQKIFFSLIIFSLLLLLPKGLKSLFDLLNLNINSLPFLEKIITFDFYNNQLVSYATFVFIVGLIGLLLHFLFIKFIRNLSYTLKKGFRTMQEQELEISRENDLKIKEKQLKAQNTSYVKCPYCGSDNLLSEKFGICTYCRRKIENKSYH